MPFRFDCPRCGATLLVEERFAGRRGPCRVCGQEIELPFSGPPAEAPAARTARRAASGLGMGVALALLLATAAAVVAALVVLGPRLREARAGSRLASARNLQAIAAAMRQYRDDWGAWPAAYGSASPGSARVSWRVLILPYLGHGDLYAQYDFAAAWDSPQNLGLVALMPSEYAGGADREAQPPGETGCFVVVGEATLFPEGRATARFGDDPASTLLAVEAAGRGIAWTEPRDLPLSELSLQIGDGRTDLGGFHDGGAVAVMADGQSYFLPAELPPEALEALLSASGGEVVPIAALGAP